MKAVNRAVRQVRTVSMRIYSYMVVNGAIAQSFREYSIAVSIGGRMPDFSLVVAQIIETGSLRVMFWGLLRIVRPSVGFT